MAKTLKELISEKSTQHEIATALGITQQAVSFWLNTGKIPAKRVKKVSEITGISPAVLNSDFSISNVSNEKSES